MNNQKLQPGTEVFLTDWAVDKESELAQNSVMAVFKEQQYEFPVIATVTDDTSDQNNAIVELPDRGNKFKQWAIDWFKWEEA